MLNFLRTGILFAVLTALFMAVGYFIGGTSGMLIAFGVAAVTNLFAFWNSDKMVLSMQGAREVDPRYLAYNVRTKRGLTINGIVSADTATSMTLKRGEGAEDTVLRTQIEAVESTGKSLMPDGLEMQIGKQDLADLIRYLLGVK